LTWQRFRQRLLFVGATAIVAAFVSALGFACLSNLTHRTTAMIHYGVCGPPNGFGLHLDSTYVTGWLAMAMPVSIAALLVSLIWAALGFRRSN
jgi:hypothetical protein